MRPHDNYRPAQIPQAFKTTYPERSEMDDLQLAVMKVLVPIATFCGWLADALPPLAAAASIFWVGFQVYNHPVMTERRARKARK